MVTLLCLFISLLSFWCRSGDFKLIHGFPGPFPDWYKPEQYDGLPTIRAETDENEMYREWAKMAMVDSNGNLNAFRTHLFNLKGMTYIIYRGYSSFLSEYEFYFIE